MMQNINMEVDPITLSVVWNKLLTITRDMGERVYHSAQSLIMGLARDLGPVILDENCRIITQAEFLPCHCLVAETPARNIVDKFNGKLDPGDVVLANDSHIIQSGHLPDWTYFAPIYYEDELLFYVHFRGHQMDTGGALSGGYFPRAYDCIAEGLNIPPVKLFKRGKVNEEVREIILNNVRTPEGIWADAKLIRGSIIRGSEAITDLVDKYDLDTIRACCREIMERDEKSMRAQIHEIPDGTYTGEATCDRDGTVMDRPISVKVKLTVKGDAMTFDFSECPSCKGIDFVNSPLGNTYTYAYMAVFLTMDPSIPHNHGSMEAIHVIAPEGSIVNPTRPATYGACACSIGCEIYEACLEALGKAIPERAMGCFNRHFSTDFSGRLPITDPRTGRDLEYFMAPFIEESGSGAAKGYDGWDGVCGSVLCGVIARGSVEENETFTPIRFNVVSLHQDIEGAGEFIGAHGTYCERECVAPPGSKTILMSGDCDGQVAGVKGAAGAPMSPHSDLFIQRPGKPDRDQWYTFDMCETFPGEILISHAAGGGGWGNPLDRDPEKIRNDVRDELISLERAEAIYGVIFDPTSLGHPERIKVDHEATEALRKAKRNI
ncbi:hydantoinase B/oxoprolinase [delta proteobacterium NaphS2]|nr:hydantoinase B/oxoprolinase [delta proteobacterium NaphS2]